MIETTVRIQGMFGKWNNVNNEPGYSLDSDWNRRYDFMFNVPYIPVDSYYSSVGHVGCYANPALSWSVADWDAVPVAV